MFNATVMLQVVRNWKYELNACVRLSMETDSDRRGSEVYSSGWLCRAT